MPSPADRSPVLAGPLLRRLEAGRVVLWLVAERPLTGQLELWEGDDRAPRQWPLAEPHCQVVPLGERAHLHLIDLAPDPPLPDDTLIGYDLRLDGPGGVADWAPHLLYPGQTRPAFVLHRRRRQLFYGSCRKPHHPQRDGLARADRHLAADPASVSRRPALLLLTGDQVYVDDVAGPMLSAVQALVRALGLPDEDLSGARITDSAELFGHPDNHNRERLLPALESNEALRERFFGGVEKPVFTSDHAHRHLITLSEMFALYLLVWSPEPWRRIAPARPPLDDEQAEEYQRQQPIIDTFVADLPAAARVMAQLPTLMIFDDHDITDDWNLTAAWERSAYGHPFSRQIIGNALIAYLLCQGWGNDPDAVAELLPDTRALLADATARGRLDDPRHTELIARLLAFQHWHYELPGTPKLVVLDTRTRRWRSERHAGRPSGLMDWEALSEFQQALLGETSVVIVSAAPIFGVKLIETVQKLFTLAGKPLTVDAENWMAHRGAARVMLNIFRHSRTPGNYVILSGDVHYSFVYRVRIRQRDGGPNVWQLTDSGLKNTFPHRLLTLFDRLNRWLYSPRSPLNWFTQRRPMAVHPFAPDHRDAGERLWNGAGIGLVTLDDQGRPERIRHLSVDGEDVDFNPL
ncbi:MAG: alkaline phosphatase family protein [Alcanivorax sp.]|nr:alkaline phosphatase family protein [Alcanivorax sp.]